jgi:hypothetical protein
LIDAVAALQRGIAERAEVPPFELAGIDGNVPVRSRNERQRRADLKSRRDEVAELQRRQSIDRLQLVMLGLEVAAAAKMVLIDVLKRQIGDERRI